MVLRAHRRRRRAQPVSGERLVLEHATTVEVQNRVVDAVIRSKAAYWVFFEGLYQAYVLGESAPYPHYSPGRHLPADYPFAVP